MSELIAIVLGVAVGLSLGALGGGGSTLAVPLLVFVAGMTAQDATTASLLVVGTASLIGAIGHFRRGNVRLGAGVVFSLIGVAGSALGTKVNRSIDEDVLLLAFSALIIFVAVHMFRSVARGPAEKDLEQAQASQQASGVDVAERSKLDLSAGSVAKLVGAASTVGLLTGLFGVGGGFAVVPALVLLLHFGTREAIGTSLVVIAINAAVALAMRSGELDFDWALVLPFLATVTLGVIGGSVLAARIHAERLTRAFALMLGAVAIYTAASTFFG